jgi:hypothetical protein
VAKVVMMKEIYLRINLRMLSAYSDLEQAMEKIQIF